ncbi:MAG: hypothetical protein ACSLE2_18980 [Lysobacterales bacterium]
MGEWTFFSNYGHVLVCLARNRDARLRDVAEEVGLTERAVQKIVRDLQQGDYLTVTKQGRCNRYRINRRKALRHALESHCTVGQLLSLVAKPGRHDQGAETELPAATPRPPEPRPPEPRPPEPRPPAPSSSKAKPQPAAEPTDKEKKPDTRQQGSLF